MKHILLTGATGYIVRQTAIFEPVGLMGLAYWYGIYPLHALMFSGMIKRIAVKAVARKPPRLQAITANRLREHHAAPRPT